MPIPAGNTRMVPACTVRRIDSDGMIIDGPSTGQHIREINPNHECANRRPAEENIDRWFRLKVAAVALAMIAGLCALLADVKNVN